MMDFYVLTWYKKSARSIIGFQCPAVILLEPRLVIYSRQEEGAVQEEPINTRGTF